MYSSSIFSFLSPIFVVRRPSKRWVLGGGWGRVFGGGEVGESPSFFGRESINCSMPIFRFNQSS